MYHLRVPKTDQELESYFHFRWAMLRKPLNQPQGSEKDGYDTYAHHQMVVDETGSLWLSAVCISMQKMKA